MERLQKILSKIGIASRRKAEELIREGRVTVNGRIARIGDQADPLRDHIKVDGKRIGFAEKKIYIALNKPKGVLSTLEDPEGRLTVLDLLRRKKPRIYPVGRLDVDAEGLILLTNDGELAYRLCHPSFQIPRTYHVKVKGKPSSEVMQRLSQGISLENGRTRPCRIRPLRETAENLWVEMILKEGRNRQVKRMWQRMGFPVLKLKRVAFGGVSLGEIRPGEYRYLSNDEIEKLHRLTQTDRPREK